MKIKVNIKNVYGNELVYPVCEKALLLAKLAGRKTFTDRDIATIKELGYIIEVATKTL